MNHRHQGIGMTSRRTRERMVNRLTDQGIINNKVLDVMRETPRHIFVDEALASRAYEDSALPVGFNQTISQPYIVAKMTELLLAKGIPEKVLEVGTGSGYQAAVLAQLVPRIFSVERILPLHQRARRNIIDLQLHNVSLKHSDGGWGWPDYAPFDGILVAAAPSEIPQMLLEQMAIGGTMAIPIGSGSQQILQKVTRTETGFEVESVERVNFVPFLQGRG